MKRNHDIALLGDILDAICRIESYTLEVNRETFLGNSMMRDAVIHQIEIIGEASNGISDKFQDEHFNLPWTLDADECYS